MNDNKLKKQAELLNKAFHQIFHSVMLGRSDMFSDKLRGFGFIDLHILDMAYENPDLILKEIRDHVKVPQTTLSSIVAKLEKRGLLNRVINRRDMRSFSLKITKKGKEIMDEHHRADLEHAEKFILLLDEQEREDLVRLLKKVGSKLE